MEDKNQIMRNIPQVEKLLQAEEIARFIPEIGRAVVADIIRSALDEVRAKAEKNETVELTGLVPLIAEKCAARRLLKLQRVINGTGVIIHTNLGRSPINEELLAGLAGALSGYCNLEFDLSDEKRGKRGGFAEELLCRATGAGDALIVNNNAASVFLILSEFGRGKEVIVSRSELIQIGGGFRLPDIMRESGAVLVEVGTTNITGIEDFRAAITPETGLIFSSHQSNFRIQGFTSAPTLQELSSLKSGSVLFVRDLGSGNLAGDQRLPGNFDPAVSCELEQGADLACFSGDKLLGGCQAGIIVGRRDLVSRLRRNPLMRMLRVDKITYFILQELLLKHLNGGRDDIALWKIIFQDKKKISARIARFMRLLDAPGAKNFARRVPTKSVIGGGAMPGHEMESLGVEITVPGKKAEELFSDFISAAVPAVGSIKDDRYILDFSTVFDNDIPHLARSADEIISKKPGS